MKNVFLTSNMGCSYKVDGKRFPKVINNQNKIIELLKKYVIMGKVKHYTYDRMI